jgi:hypothetical protein
MRYAAILIGCAILAGCNSEPDVDMKNASVGEVVNEVQKAGVTEQYIRPGKWETKVTVEDIDIPGMPASTKSQMKNMFAERQNVTIDHCVSPEQAKKPDGKFFSGQDSKNCRYEHFTMGNGKIDAVMRCQGESSGSMTMKMTGSFTPESSSTRSEMQVSSGREGTMTIKARSDARRVGECDGKEG